MKKLVLIFTCLGLSFYALAGDPPEGENGYWIVSLEVNGDAYCDPERKPEPYQIKVLPKNEIVEALSSTSVSTPEGFLQEPFSPNNEESSFLSSVV